MTEQVEEVSTERVNMNWPVGLKDRVRDHAGARGLTTFVVDAVENRLVDEDRVLTLEKEVSELRYLSQLLADRYVMGGDTDDREAFLMEVDLPSWVSTDGWPSSMAKQVQREHVDLARVPSVPPTPIGVPAPVQREEPAPQEPDDEPEEQVDERGELLGDPELHVPMFMTGSKGNDFFDRVQAKAAEKGMDISNAGLVPASALPVPERTEEKHNHAWVINGNECECGAIIEKPSAEHPTGIVRPAGYEPEPESSEPEPTVQMPVEKTVVIERSLDDFDVDF